MNAGISFSPLGQQNGQTQGNGQNNAATPPVQDAIRLLSLKLPSVLGPTAPSGVAFATPSPLGQQLGSALAQNWLRGLFSPSTPVQSGANTPDVGALFQQLLNQIGAPSFTNSAPGATPAGGRTSVKLEGPGQPGALTDAIGNPSMNNQTEPNPNPARVPSFGLHPPFQFGIPGANGGVGGGSMAVPSPADFQGLVG